MKIKILLIFLAISLFACDKYDEVHTEFLESMDEQKYSVIPENVILHSGYKRLFVSADIVYTTSLSKFIVEINEQVYEFDIPSPVLPFGRLQLRSDQFANPGLRI
jgi:hypothetical protein